MRLPRNRETTLKYQVTYRLRHPHYMPALSVAVIEASSHTELEAKLAKIKIKWQARGYRVQITLVTKQKAVRR